MKFSRRRPASPFCSLFAVLVISGLAACKIVPDPDPEQAGEAQADQSDEARMARFAAEIWEPKVLPVVADKLVALPELRAALRADAEKASATWGLRQPSESNPWNYAISGSGKIVAANLKSRAARLEVDSDGDGKADVKIQLGPVIRGTAIRDSMPFLVFTDYRDQIEFAQVANALNTVAHERTAFPEGEPVGQTLHFEGVFTLKGQAEEVELVPTRLRYEP